MDVGSILDASLFRLLDPNRASFCQSKYIGKFGTFVYKTV